TFGIISCKDRSLGVMGMEGYQQTGQFNTWLQIDALINPGNSGGPLVNMEGAVVGINTRGGMGMGFAVPINIAKAVSTQIIDTGKVKRSWIGITFQPIEKFKKNFLGDIAKGGVLVANVDEDSPASKAGIQPGDIFVKVDGKAVSARFEEEIYPMAKMVADLPIGTKLDVEYVRKKVKKSARLVTEPLENVEGEEEEFKEWGFTAKELTRSLAREMRLQVKEGILVSGAVNGSVMAKAEVGYGDLLTEVDGKAVKNLEQFGKLYKKLLESGKEKLLAKVLKGGRTPKIVVLDQSALVKKEEEEKKEEGGEDY
ncbi:MAG: PDZ domain-containing protein, partial [Planctomycetota bacterium]